MGSKRRNIFVLLSVVLLVGAALWVIATKPTVLGLDLRGGTELVFQARPSAGETEVASEDVDRAMEVMRSRVDSLGVAEPEISRVGADQIEVGLPNVQESARAIEQVGTTSQLYLYDFDADVIPPNPDIQDPNERTFNRLYDAVTFAADFAEENPDDVNCDNCTTNGPTYYLFDEQTLQPLAGPAAQEDDLYVKFDGEKPENSKVLEVPQGLVVIQKEDTGVTDSLADTDAVDEANASSPPQYFVLHDRPKLTGDQIRNPQANFDPNTNQPIVTFEFTKEGREAFHETTREISRRGFEEVPVAAQAQICTEPEAAANFAQKFAIILDNKAITRPIINFCELPNGIDGRTGAQISGNFTVQSSQELAEFLRFGALPVNLFLVSQSTVSATLGQQALDEGLLAGGVGLLLLLIFLIAYYRLLGVIAGLGLIVYGILFFALIKLIPITLTLPGIAGLILTFGVATDSNIVIFERIKEEIAKGKGLSAAIAAGYRRGISAIIDANVIILMVAFVLFALATAGVRGFAFTLGVGVIVSLFTAVIFTQAILGVFGRTKLFSSQERVSGSKKRSWNFDFTGKSKYFFLISGVILVIGSLAFATKGLNLGLDFQSGTRIHATLEKEAPVEDVRSLLSEGGIPNMANAEIKEVGEGDESALQIRTKFGDESDDTTLSDEEASEEQESVAQIRELLDSEYTVVDYQVTSIGPTFGAAIARSAVLGLIFSFLLISIYVSIRFQPKYAIPVLIALSHDILITGGIYALIGAEVSSGTIAAFLTILGYSMYDTVIVFDRIRENIPRMPRAAFSQIVNRSVSEIFTRSIMTGVSTLLVLVALLIFGGETLRDFALVMTIGVISGFYSSIFIATPVLTEWKEREPRYRDLRARIQEAMGYVPVFPEDNEVATIEDVEMHRRERKATDEVSLNVDDTDDLYEHQLDDEAENAAGDDAGSEGRETPKERAERQRRERRGRNRKHGRNR